MVQAPSPVLPKPLRSAVWWSIVTILVFLAVEAAIFRSGFYLRYLQPESSAGNVEDALYWLRHAPVAPQGEVVVVGDSRVAEGFSVMKADAAVENRIKFRSLAIGGMSIRNWYYLLRDVDPDRHRFRAVVIGLERYTDDEHPDTPPDRIRDLNYSIGRLRLTDCWDFAMSMKSHDHRQTALSGCLFRGLVLRADFHEFLLDPKARLKSAREWHESGLGWTTGYTGIDRKLTGISADPAHREIKLPPGLDPMTIITIRQSLTPEWPQDIGEHTRYRQLWLGRILDLYRNTPTQVIFIEMPRAPLPVPDTKVQPRFIQSVIGRPRVTVVQPGMFREYERAELFADGFHLNSEGRALFSAKLAHLVEPIVSANNLGSR